MQTIHTQILESLNLKPGDTVKVTHKVPTHNLGWGNSWTIDMNNYVGNTYIVKSIHLNCGVKLKSPDDIDYEFPAQCIEVISRHQDVTINGYKLEVFKNDKYIKFGCQTFTFEEVHAIWKLFKIEDIPNVTINFGNTIINEKMIYDIVSSL